MDSILLAETQFAHMALSHKLDAIWSIVNSASMCGCLTPYVDSSVHTLLLGMKSNLVQW
jgi:hypothetical protein